MKESLLFLCLFGIFALAFLISSMFLELKSMQRKLDKTVRLMTHIRSRHNVIYVSMLYSIMANCVKLEMYEEAARLKKLIDELTEEAEK